MHSKWAGKEENEGTERVKRENNKEQRPSRVGVSLRKMVNNVRKEKQPRGSIFPKGGGETLQAICREKKPSSVNKCGGTTTNNTKNWTELNPKNFKAPQKPKIRNTISWWKIKYEP